MAKKPAKSGMRDVPCTYCGGPIQVSQQALSIFCPHCHKRVVCEDYCIKSYHAVRLFATCGDIVVERKGHVVAPILANSLVVRGLVKGDVRVQSVVEIEATGTIQGNVEAPRLILREGGKLIGQCKIIPKPLKVPSQPVPTVPGEPKEPAKSTPVVRQALGKSAPAVRPSPGGVPVVRSPFPAPPESRTKADAETSRQPVQVAVGG